MSKTSTEVKQRWIENNYKRIFVNLRYDTDKDIIQFIEDNKSKEGTTELFRQAMRLLMQQAK